MRVWVATSEQPSRYAILAFGEPAPKRLGCERSERESQPKRRPTRTPSDQCDQVTKYTGRERSEGARRAAQGSRVGSLRTGRPPRPEQGSGTRASREVSDPASASPEPRSGTPAHLQCLHTLHHTAVLRPRQQVGSSPNPVRAPLVARLLAIRAFFDRFEQPHRGEPAPLRPCRSGTPVEEDSVWAPKEGRRPTFGAQGWCAAP